MALITVIKQIKAKQLFGFFRFFIRHPFFAVATFFATVKTYRIAERQFPKIHGKHNKANAFRHALWNWLIARACYKYSKNIEKVIRWTKDVTDWHEELFINEELPRLMDEHNNAIGRGFFAEYVTLSHEQIVEFLLKKIDGAVMVVSIVEVEKNPLELVYLED
ncbi:hypothetical protein KH5_01800 [Urechidicola sp. KH5]